MEGPGAESGPEAALARRLEARLGEDPGAPAFPALAEAHRRAGDAKRAERVARAGLARDPESPAGRLALALALLDGGALEDARAELERVLERVADHPRARAALASLGAEPRAAERGEGLEGLVDAEIEDAFEGAEARAEEMVDANRLAEAAMRRVEGGGLEPPEAEAETEAEAEAEAEPESPAARSPFATPTMAELLERQGYGEEARRLRDSLGSRAPEEGAAGAPRGSDRETRRRRTLAVLERWLAQLRRASR